MFSSVQNQPQSATIINIHSPEDELHPVSENDFSRRPSSTSRPTSQPSTHSHAVPKPSPKVEEYRKMIRHIINKIIKRKRPPTALSHLNEFSRATKVIDTFENDDTIDLLIQLRSALMVCHQIGLSMQVLFQGERTPTNSPLSSRSNSPSPSPHTESPIRSPEPFGATAPMFSLGSNQSKKNYTEFDTILYILSDLILNDSRYKTSNPKPSRPPFTMQAILIDIAIILTQIREGSSGLYHIGTVFIPAFESFSEGTMLGRLLSFFLDNLLPKLMKCKDEPKSRLSHKPASNEAFDKSFHNKTTNPNTPTINIQSPEPDQLSVPLKASHLTIDTRPLTVAAQSSSPISPAAFSSNSSHQVQSPSTYHAYSLFTPLLFFMIQYLDPYLAAQPNRAQQENLTYTLTRQANSIHNFHRALSYMMSSKPDLYLDLLDIISHSTSEVKFRACQILFNYYIVSVGHVVVADPLPRIGTHEELEILDQRRLQQELEEEHQRNHQQLNNNSNIQNWAAKNPTGSEAIDDHLIEEQHIWYPYMFDENDHVSTILSNNPFSFNVHKDPTDTHCKECFKTIRGCGLRCFQCKSNIHLNCFNSKAHLDSQGMLFYLKAGGIQKVVAPQYCLVSPQPRYRDMVDRGLLQWSAKSGAAKVGLLGHLFQLINLYTITLCTCCHLPLWGTCFQAYQCTTCYRFIHPKCLVEMEESVGSFSANSSRLSSSHKLQTCSANSSLQEADIKISQSDLDKSLIEFYDNALPTQVESLNGKSFEEVNLMTNVLLIQESILHCGVASGCIIITQESDDPLLLSPMASSAQGKLASHSNVLSQAIEIYTNFLNTTEDIHVSSFYAEFFGHSDLAAVKHLLNKENFLCHLGAMMKSLTTASGNNPSFQTNSRQQQRASDSSQGFLQVSTNPFTANTWEEDEYHNDLSEEHTPSENLDRSALLSWVMTNLNFKCLKAAEILLQHMRNIGIFERFDASPLLFAHQNSPGNMENESAVQCIFPVPYAIDFSANVESLVNSIEACMQDIDLSINECGLLLLVRRCWPDPFMSDYTQERLIHAIVGWAFDEDERLLALHAEVTSLNRHSSLHHAKQQNKWVQAALLARMKGPASSERSRQSTFQVNTTAASVSSGASNIYVATRVGLKDRYVARWMSAVQKMNPEAYTEMVYNAIENIIDNKREESIIPNWEEFREVKNHTIQKYELFINYIAKLKNNGLTFDCLDAILQKWFERTYSEFLELGILQDKEPSELRNLVKLCSSKSTQGRFPGNASSSSVNPIDVVTSQFQSQDRQSIDRGMRWLTLMAYSGVDLTSNALSRISKLIIGAKAPFDLVLEFIKIVWFQVVHINAFAARRAAIADLIGYVGEATLETLSSFNNSQNLSDASLVQCQSFVKYSAALICFAYGCSIDEIAKATIVPFTGEHVMKSSKRASVAVDFSMMEVDGDTPSICNMLSYLQFSQLNLREYVTKMFYCLTQSSHSISNKEEFIVSCIPKLMPIVWDLLSPAYDDISHINLNLLMHLINLDVRYFEACVFKIFEDANWEVRYQGLDNLFGLFTKMDAAFQTEWLKLLSKLGPVFSYFVGCLWDKEEYVRLKAFALIRSFGTLHLQSAFRCWEAYFLTATDRQKMSLVSLMIQLNALFPEWQVLQWESLLEALESKLIINPLDDYSNSSADRDFVTKDSQISEPHSAESENVQALMLTLALEMLSNHLSIEPIQLYRFKFILVQQMNFDDCHYANEGGEITVSFGALRYNPNDPSQVAIMLTCIRGLKKVMDSFAPLPAEAVANIASESFEQNRINLAENSSPGVHFIDVVLKTINSGIDLTKIGHMTLKAWLEIVLIIVYKHNILERSYEQSIVTCMKQIIEVLTEQISDENKLLILEILKCLLKRSDHLTAMVLSKQILALGKLMTKLGMRHSEPVYMKAKQFLKSAFLRFAVAGLFVLMFKNQATADTSQGDVDLFYVLRTVIDPDDIIPDEEFQGEIIYLRDQPVRDVLDKLMKQQMERKSFSTVLFNTSKYVEVVHSSPYAESILNDYASFLQALVKHTSDWRRSDWNINPVFTMSATLLKEHPYHHVLLLPSIQAVLKHGLTNCTIQADAVVKLMVAYAVTVPGAKPSTNVFAKILIEEVKNALSVLTRPSKDTLLVLLQIILYDIKPTGHEWYNKIETSFLGKPQEAASRNHKSYFDTKLFDLLPFFVNYLKRTTTSQQFTRKDFKIYSCIARLVVFMASKDPKLTVIIFGYLKLEEGVQCLRFLNWFILTLLKEQADAILPEIIGYENVITDFLVRTLNTVEIDFHAPDLNFSYSPASEKLLLSFLLLESYSLLKIRYSVIRTDKVSPTDSPLFWMAVWPAIRRLLDTIESSTLFTTGNVGVSIWNMFLSLLQFLFTTRNAVVVINAYEWSDLLNSLLKKTKAENNSISQGDDIGVEQLITLDDFQKQIEKIKNMFDVPPVEVPLPIIIEQLLIELRDAMRLQAESIVFQGSSRDLMHTLGSTF